MNATTVRPLFIFGIARSGTNLLARVLDAHPAVEIALDPFMPLFRTMRNATIAQDAGATLQAEFDPHSSFQDGYQRSYGYKLLDLLLACDLSAAIKSSELPNLRAAVAARAGLEAPDVAARVNELAGKTCRDLITSALDIVASCRGTAATRYVGIKEVWVLDFLPALARAFPEARFLAIERDPRAVIASLTALAERDPSQRAHPISYLRHWRKGVVLARRFAADATLAERFHLVRYEELAANPAQSAHRLTEFLDIDFDPRMLAPAEPRNGSDAWMANSSYSGAARGINSASIERWRDSLPGTARRTVEFFCWPEMALANYPLATHARPSLSREIAEYVAQADADPGSWRSDSGNRSAELEFETGRHELLSHRQDPIDFGLVRRCFLFQSAYADLLAASLGDFAPVVKSA